MPSALSGGEKQRISLGRALMINPQILLLDEPLSALDVSARRSLRSYLAGYLAERAGPTLVVTHDLRDVLALKAHVYVIEAGRIVQHGSVETLSAQPATDFVAEFFDLSGN
jgi:ABC-type sulfate/molybdate transport systems ATPase subunit